MQTGCYSVRRWASRLLLACAIVGGLADRGTAQDLEPRAYAAAPTGLNFVVVAGGRSTGGVLVDPSLPIEDVEATINSLAVGYGRTFGLFNRTAMVAAAVPTVWLEATGLVADVPGRASRTGLADPRVKLSVNLVGGQALKPREFARATRPTIVGISVSVGLPLGQYDRTKLINLGAHRWSFKPEVGVSRLIGKWTIDGYAGVWLFTPNDTFYTGESRRTQRPIVAVQAHASYTVKPRLWFSADSTWYSGGTSSINGVAKADLQRNSRLGATVSLPLRRSQSLKISASTGATTRSGSSFKTIVAAWQLSWLD